MDESEQVFDVELPSGGEPADVVHPGEEPLDSPAVLVATELAPILSFASVAAVRGDHLNAVFDLELLVELVRVVSLVPDQSDWKFAEKASGKNFFNKLALGRRSALDRDGGGRLLPAATATIFVSLPKRVEPTAKPPFFVLAKVASTNASSRLSLPCA